MSPVSVFLSWDLAVSALVNCALSSVSPSRFSMTADDQTRDEEGVATLSGGSDKRLRLPLVCQRFEKAPPHPTALWALRPRVVRHALLRHRRAWSRR